MRFNSLLWRQATGQERKQKICEFVAFGKMKKKYFLVRLLITLFSSLLIFLFILPYLLLLFKVINIGNILGLCIGFFILFIGLFLPRIINIIKKLLKLKLGKILILFLSSILVIGFIFFTYAQYLMISKISTKNQQINTVIVLGCRVIGETPSIMLNERINACYKYLTNNPYAIAILSGGQGIDEGISEAECMYRALLKKGISEDRLLKENQSTSTKENLTFSKQIILEKQLSTEVMIITNDYHCYRAAYFAKQLGLQPKTYSAKTHWYLLPTFYLREICAIIFQCIL